MKIDISTTIPLAISVPVAFGISTQDIMKLYVKNRRGFTLAETLITLTIIGVIAAMTVPTLVTNYTKQTYVTGLKKVYSQLQNAVKMAVIAEGCSVGDYSCLFGNNYYDYYTFDVGTIVKQMKIVKTATIEDDECGGLAYNSSVCWIAADGVQFTSSAGEGLPGIIVDLNGVKGPNIMGRDRFYFFIAKETQNGISAGTILPYGSKALVNYKNSESFYWESSNYYAACVTSKVSKTNVYSGMKCAGRVLEEGKMDY